MKMLPQRTLHDTPEGPQWYENSKRYRSMKERADAILVRGKPNRGTKSNRPAKHPGYPATTAQIKHLFRVGWHYKPEELGLTRQDAQNIIIKCKSKNLAKSKIPLHQKSNEQLSNKQLNQKRGILDSIKIYTKAKKECNFDLMTRMVNNRLKKLIEKREATGNPIKQEMHSYYRKQLDKELTYKEEKSKYKGARTDAKIRYFADAAKEAKTRKAEVRRVRV
jgi:hypothetical protein